MMAGYLFIVKQKLHDQLWIKQLVSSPGAPLQRVRSDIEMFCVQQYTSRASGKFSC